MVLGGATFQDTVIDDKIKPKAKVPSEARRVPSRTEGPPRWAKLAGTKYMDWFKRHTDKDMCKNMLNMMTKPAHHHALDREIDLIKAIQQFNGIKRVENEKMGWNEADFTVWLFLEFAGKVKTTAGVRSSENPVHVRATVFINVDQMEWEKKDVKFSEVKFIFEEVLFSEQTGKWLTAPKKN